MLCDADRTHPRDAKEAMAKGVVSRYWGAAAADEAAAAFRRVFAQGKLPDDMPEVSVPADGISILDLLVEPPLAFAKSRGEARRLIKQGGVKIDDVRVDDAEAVVTIDGESVLRCGKRRFAKLVRA